MATTSAIDTTINSKKKTTKKKDYRKIQIELPTERYETYIEQFERFNERHKELTNEPLLKGKYFGKVFLAGEKAKAELANKKLVLEPKEIIEKKIEIIKTKNSPWLIAGFSIAVLGFVLLLIAFVQSIPSK